MPIALDLLKSQMWPNEKPEVHLQHYGRRYKIDIIQNHMPTAVKRSIWKPEVAFQYGDRLF